MGSLLGRYRAAVSVLFLGSVLSVILFNIVQDQEQARSEAEFERQANSYVAAIQKGIERNLEVVESIAGLYAASAVVERQDFGVFVKSPLLRHQDIQALSWNQRVKDSDRASYEAAKQSDQFPSFQITERKAQDQMERAEHRAEYISVSYIEPLKGNEAALGFDVASNPSRLKALERSRDAGEMVATARVTLVQETEEQYGVLILRPVYTSGTPHETVEQRRQTLRGFAVGVFRIGDMVESSVVTLPEAIVNIQLDDEGSALGERLLYLRQASLGEGPTDEEQLEARGGLYLRVPLEIPGRQWSVLISPTREFLARPGRWQAWVSLAVGLLITAFLVAYLISTKNHAAKIETLAAKLTMSNEDLKREITDRKLAVEMLKHQARLLENVNDAVIASDERFVTTAWNRAAEEMYGWTAEEIIGRLTAEVLQPEFVDVEPDEVVRRLLEEGSFEGEVIHSRKDGTRIHTEARAMALRDKDGRISGFVSIDRDITERKLAEEKNRRLALAVANASDGVMITEMDGQISFINRAGEKMLGYAPGEMHGMKVFDIHPESLKETTAREILEATRNEGSWTGEVSLIQKTGEDLHVGLSTALMKDDEGHALGMVGISTDVTERRQLPEQLVQAQKMEAIGRLAGGVAHDFNNLLTVIIGYSHLGQGELQTGEGRVHTSFREIQRAAERASALTQKLLAFSRHQVVEPKVVSLSDLVLDMDGMLRRFIGENVELVTLPAPYPAMVRIDTGQTEQVLTNLLVNARDAMPNGGKLTIKTSNVMLDQEGARRHPEAKTGDYVVLEVTDTGIGMTEEVMSHIFEPFFTTKGVGEGTGLGLSTCYGIVSKIGGHITVECEPGNGSTFKVYLPRVDEAASQPPMREKSDELPLGTETVFLVEDEPVVRKMASQVLRNQGYTVLESTNGVEALRVADEHASGELHLLLTDIVMPLMGGRDLAERFRMQHPETRVLYISGYTDEAVLRPDPLKTGTDFIQKPFTPVTLALKVREVLDM